MEAMVTRRIAGTATAILDLATDTATWPAWLRIAAAERPVRLAAPGAEVAGTWGRGRQRVAVTWRVTRRVRDIVQLDAVHPSGTVVATLTIACATWYDDCATELRISTSGREPWRLRRQIAAEVRRALPRLAALAAGGDGHERPASEPRASARQAAWASRGVPAR